jgi:hypothetical protein
MVEQNPSVRPHQQALLLATLLAVVVWAVPMFTWVMLPLQYLNAHLHETSHALMALLTGGEVQKIQVFADGSGITPVLGGGTFLIASAGYVGAALIGASMVYFGRSERGARFVLRAVAGTLALAMAIWVRGDLIGVLSGVGWIGVLLLSAASLRGLPLLIGVQFFGIQQCLTSIQAVYTVLRISALSEGHSDAQILASITGVPAIVWAFTWCAVSGILVLATVRAAWSHHPEPGPTV